MQCNLYHVFLMRNFQDVPYKCRECTKAKFPSFEDNVEELRSFLKSQSREIDSIKIRPNRPKSQIKILQPRQTKETFPSSQLPKRAANLQNVLLIIRRKFADITPTQNSVATKIRIARTCIHLSVLLTRPAGLMAVLTRVAKSYTRTFAKILLT